MLKSENNKFYNSVNKIFSSEADEFIRGRFYVKFIFLCLFLFLSLSFIFFLIFIKAGSEVQIPNLNEKNITEAIAELQNRKLETYIIQKYSSEVPRYAIINQKPEPGTLVKQGRKITLFVSLGKKIAKMPSYTNQDFYLVKNQFQSLFAGFEKAPKIVDIWEYSSNIEKDRIIAHSPAMDEEIIPERDVVFLVSKGIATNIIEVKKYKNYNYKEVKKELENIGISVFIKSKIVLDNRYIGKILGQSIEKGTELKKGDNITFLVGIGKDINIDITQKEVYRIYSMRIPYPSGLSYMEDVSEQEVEIQIVVYDALGEEEIFKDSGKPGEYIDVPYATSGEGYLLVYINNKYHTRESFN